MTGGCYCKAIRYTIKVPRWEDRPAVPGAVDTPISADEKVQTRLPLINIDHCNSCREVSGAMVQVWIISLLDWVKWDVQLEHDQATTDSSERRILSTVEAVGPIQEGKTTPSTYLTRFNRTDQATRTFCSRCGTTLTYLSHKRLNTPAAFVDITVASLDPEFLELVKPDRHNWWDSGVSWAKDLLRHGDGGFTMRHSTGDVRQALDDN